MSKTFLKVSATQNDNSVKTKTTDEVEKSKLLIQKMISRKPRKKKLKTTATEGDISVNKPTLPVADLQNLFASDSEDELPKPPAKPIIAPKKRKKPDQPYIVGCKDREKVAFNPKTKVGAGDLNYEENSEYEDEENYRPPRKYGRKKRTARKISNLILNTTSPDAIASMSKTKKQEDAESNFNKNEDKTIEKSPRNLKNLSEETFSPLPSTSKDQNIINQNEMNFSKSFRSSADISSNSNDSDDTVIIDLDEYFSPKIQKNKDLKSIKLLDSTNDSVQLIEKEDDVIILEDTIITDQSNVVDELTENTNQPSKSTKKEKTKIDPPVSYSTIDTSFHLGETNDDEIIDLDDYLDNLIKSNENKIKEFKNRNNPNTVIQVNNTSVITIVDTPVKEPTKRPTSQGPSLPRKEAIITTNVSSVAASNDVVIVASTSNTQAMTENQTSTSEANGRSTNKELLNTPHSKQGTVPNQQSNSPKRIRDCPICFDNMLSKAIASTNCGHLFCMVCIKTALKSSGKRCPTCRKTLKGAGYHQIFL